MADYTQPDHVEKRLRYSDGQFLVVQDFIDEQKYHIDRQRRQTRLLRTSGILEGLQVTPASASAEAVSVEVAPGTAIDLKGRAIILSEKHVVDLTEHIGTTVTLAIAYVEERSDPPISDRGSSGLTRFHEKVAFEVVKNGETSTLDSAIDIVQIKINDNRSVSINADHTFNNFYSGLKFGNTDLRNPEISLKPVSRGLQLTGNLTISGSLTASGNLTANQDIVARRVLTFPLATRSNNQEINFGRGEYGIGVQPDTQYFRTAKNFAWYKDGTHSNEALNPGNNGSLQMVLDLAGRLGIGTFNPQSLLDVNGGIKSSSLNVDGPIKSSSMGVIFEKGKNDFHTLSAGQDFVDLVDIDLTIDHEVDLLILAHARQIRPPGYSMLQASIFIDDVVFESFKDNSGRPTKNGYGSHYNIGVLNGDANEESPIMSIAFAKAKKNTRIVWKGWFGGANSSMKCSIRYPAIFILKLGA